MLRLFCSCAWWQAGMLPDPCGVGRSSQKDKFSKKVKQEELLASDRFLTPHRWFPEELTVPVGSLRVFEAAVLSGSMLCSLLFYLISAKVSLSCIIKKIICLWNASVGVFLSMTVLLTEAIMLTFIK